MNLSNAIVIVRWFALPSLALIAACASTPTPAPLVIEPAAVATPSGIAVDSRLRQTLAPSGRLRVAVYRGSPSSIVEGAGSTEPRGVGYDLGREMARRLGVPFEPVVHAKNADALAAIQAGTADVAFTNASPERARNMDFSPSFMDVEKSFLVSATSPLTTIVSTKRPGLRIGVSEGSSTERELAPDYGQAVMVRVPTLKAAGEMVADGRIDAFATNKAILFEVSDGVPSSRVLPGSWGMEHFAAAIPKGRDSGRPFVDDFVASIQRDGTAQRAIARAGLRGTVEAVAANGAAAGK